MMRRMVELRHADRRYGGVAPCDALESAHGNDQRREVGDEEGSSSNHEDTFS